MDNFEDFLNERKRITLKRRYTENHPALEAGFTAKVRNKVLSEIADGQITQEEFNALVSELSGDSKRWLRRNAKYFSISEDGVKLSKFGQRALSALSVNEEEEIDEARNAFITAARAAKAEGLKEFEFQGKTFPVTVKDVSEEEDSDESVQEETQNTNNTMNEAIKVESREAKKVFAALKKFFEVTASGLSKDKANLLLALKQITMNGMEDANFHREMQAVGKAFPKATPRAYRPLSIKLAELGGHEITLTNAQVKQFIESHYSLASSAAGFAGIGVVEGAALYLESIGFGNEAQGVVNAFNSFFEAEEKIVSESFESFSALLKEEQELEGFEILEEAFSSSVLRDAFSNTNTYTKEKKVDKRLAKAFYQNAKIALDKVQDEDISIMTPAEAYKIEKKNNKKTYGPNVVTIYVSDRQKDNPYDDYYPGPMDIKRGTIRQKQQIPGGGFILAITDGRNNFLGVSGWKGQDGLKKPSKSTSRSYGADPYGISKKYKGYGSYGLYNVKRIADVADRAFVLNIDALRDKYSVSDVTTARAEAKKGAAAFKSDKEFRKENQNRYYDILKQRASETNIDEVVKEIIERMSNAVTAGLAAGETGAWGNIMIPGTQKSVGEATRVTSTTLDKYERYIGYKKKVAEWEKETGGKYGNGSSYYEDEAAAAAKVINDILKSVKAEYAV